MPAIQMGKGPVYRPTICLAQGRQWPVLSRTIVRRADLRVFVGISVGLLDLAASRAPSAMAHLPDHSDANA